MDEDVTMRQEKERATNKRAMGIEGKKKGEREERGQGSSERVAVLFMRETHASSDSSLCAMYGRHSLTME